MKIGDKVRILNTTRELQGGCDEHKDNNRTCVGKRGTLEGYILETDTYLRINIKGHNTCDTYNETCIKLLGDGTWDTEENE